MATKTVKRPSKSTPAAPTLRDMLGELAPGHFGPDATYLGVCIVNAPGRWTRMGLTWRVPLGWVCLGPGVARWGTSKGLAELAVSLAPSPQWHEASAVLVPEPFLVLPCTPEVVSGRQEMQSLVDRAKAEELIP